MSVQVPERTGLGRRYTGRRRGLRDRVSGHRLRRRRAREHVDCERSACEPSGASAPGSPSDPGTSTSLTPLYPVARPGLRGPPTPLRFRAFYPAQGESWAKTEYREPGMVREPSRCGGGRGVKTGEPRGRGVEGRSPRSTGVAGENEEPGGVTWGRGKATWVHSEQSRRNGGVGRLRWGGQGARVKWGHAEPASGLGAGSGQSGD